MPKPKMPARGRHRLRLRGPAGRALSILRRVGGRHTDKRKQAARDACRGKVALP